MPTKRTPRSHSTAAVSSPLACRIWFPEPALVDDTYCRRGESTCDWLQRSTIARARECRRFLNEHLSKLPLQTQGKFFHDLRHRWDSTFFELFTARILQELGASITVEETKADGRRPDFTAEFGDAAVVVEAVAPMINQAASEKEAARIPLLNMIETKLPNGWLVAVWELPDIGAADSKKEFERSVARLFDVPPPSPTGREREVIARLPQGVIHLQLFPARANHKRVGLEAPIALVDNTQLRIRHALKSKRRQVRSSELPVLLAIQAAGHSSDLEDFDTVLFGASFEGCDRGGLRVASGYRADGVFNRGSGKRPTYAGVLAFLTTGFNACSAPVLYLHPRSAVVLPKGLLQLETRRYDPIGKKVCREPSKFAALTETLHLVTA